MLIFSIDSSAEHKEFATSRWTQFIEVYKRMNLVWYRSPTYNWGRIFNALFISILSGFTFYKAGSSIAGMQQKVFSVLDIVLMGNSLVLLAQPMFMRQRQYFRYIA